MTLVDTEPAVSVTQEHSAPARRRSRWTARRVVTLVLLIVMTLLWIYPFIWLVSASLKQSSEIFSSGLNLMPETFRWENYARAWTEAGFAQYFLNTVVITVGTIVIVVVRSALAGYVLGRFAFPGKTITPATVTVSWPRCTLYLSP